MKATIAGVVLAIVSAILAGGVTSTAAAAIPSTAVADAVHLAAASSATPVYRFWSPVYQGHFYTADPVERDGIISQWSDTWTYEGVAYNAYTTQVPGTVPLYRFWSARYHGHFYTADQGERDGVIASWSGTWAYEGVAYYVYPSASTQADTTPVFRFWSASAGHHFYTASAGERDGVINNWSSVWGYEGPVFRVPTAGVPADAATPPPTSVPAGGFPTRTSAGLPAGWTPKTQVTGDLWIRQAGQVVEDLRITNGTIFVTAPNVTLRRIQAIGAKVNNGPGSSCANGLLVENSTFTANGRTTDTEDPVIQFGGYTANNIVIDGVPEGLRVGGLDLNCGPVSVSNSYINVVSPTVCNDWHGDGIQGYGGNKLTVRQTTLVMTVNNNCWGTAPFFYPSGQGNTSVDIDGLLVSGGGYPFRNGMPGPIKNLKVVDRSWVFNPVDVNCSAVTAWNAQVVKLDTAGQPTTVRSISCAGQGN